MAPPRTFELDALKDLLKNEPDWSNVRYAQALTDANKAKGLSIFVSPQSVAQAIYTHRWEWEAEGISIRVKRRRSGLVSALTANTGITIPDGPLQSQMELRYMRALDRMAEGLPVKPESLIVPARNWEARLRRERHVIDLYPDGTVFERPAAPHELDRYNQLVSIVAAYRPN
jgi:hypothetical protein